MPGVIDSQGYPHIIEQIFEVAPREALLALRTASRSFRDAADSFLDVEHLVVDLKSRSRRLTLRSLSGQRIPALCAYEALYDLGLGEDRQAPSLNLAPPHPIPKNQWDHDDDYLWVVDELGKYQRSDDEFSVYVPSEDGMESDVGDDVDVRSSVSQGYEDNALRREMIRRSYAELDEIEACPQCQEWEAAALRRLEREGEMAVLEAQHKQDLREWFSQHKNATRIQALYPENPEMWPEIPPRPEKPVLIEDEDNVERSHRVHEHDHPHEAANRPFWGQFAMAERTALELFAKTVTRMRVLDVPGPALLHDLAAFPNVEIIRYFGYPSHSPAWWEFRAPTTVRFIDIVPPTPKGWSRATQYDMTEPTRVHVPGNDGESEPQEFRYYDERSLMLYRTSGSSQRKWVTAIKYHPAHPRLSACRVYVRWPKHLPNVEEEVAIMIPDTSEPPVNVAEIEDISGDPVGINDHMYDSRYVPRMEEKEHELGPLNLWLYWQVYGRVRELRDEEEIQARSRLTVVGLLDMGNAALGLRDDCSVSESFPNFVECDTEQRVYACLTYWFTRICETVGVTYPEGAWDARQFVRLLSHDEYRQEVGDWQYHMETVE